MLFFYAHIQQKINQIENEREFFALYSQEE